MNQFTNHPAGFLQKIVTALAQLKQQLQQDYQQAYPALGEIIHLILDEEEARAWDLTSFPHLLLPDLVEAHVAKLGLQPAVKKQDEVRIPHRVLEVSSYQPALAYVDC